MTTVGSHRDAAHPRRLDASPHGLNRRVKTVLHAVVGAYLIVAAVAPYLYGNFIAVGLVGCLAVALISRCPIPRHAMGWTLGIVALGAVGVLHGLIRGHEGALETASIFVVEPLLLGLLLPMLFRTGSDIRVLLRYVDAALVTVSIVGFLIYLREVTGASIPIGALLDPRFTAIEVGDSTLRSNYQGFNSLVFLAPYGLVRSMTVSSIAPLRIGHRVLLVLAALTGTMLAGASVLYVSTPLAMALVFLGLARRQQVRRRMKKATSWLLPIAGATALLALMLQMLGLGVGSGLAASLSEITLVDRSGVRAEQSERLLEKWSESPLLGHGTGTTIDGYVRDPTAPWRFELSHHVVLVTFGLLGVVVLGAWLCWIARRLLAGARAAHVYDRAVLAGLLGAVLASSVNPYLFKIDGIWMVFVPFSVAVARGAMFVRRRVALDRSIHATPENPREGRGVRRWLGDTITPGLRRSHDRGEQAEDAATPDVLFLLVVYNNHDEVQRWISEVSCDRACSVAFAICDNSPIARSWEPAAGVPVSLVARPDNPGYLEGGLVALEHYVASVGRMPPWIFLSNSDLVFGPAGLGAVVSLKFEPDIPVIIAPRITEITSSLERNPHIRSPRSRFRLWANRLVTWYTPMAYLYLIASELRLHRAKRGPRSVPGELMYAPYGAMVCFSRGFLEGFKIPRNVPLLAEEWAIAEVARNGGVPVVFEPRIHVYHRSNATTGPPVSWRRAVLLRRAFWFMYKQVQQHGRVESKRPFSRMTARMEEVGRERASGVRRAADD